MELLVADIKNLQSVKSADGAFLDVNDWPGVQVQDGSVINIAFEESTHTACHRRNHIVSTHIVGLEGSIDLQWVPQDVLIFLIASVMDILFFDTFSI